MTPAPIHDHSREKYASITRGSDVIIVRLRGFKGEPLPDMPFTLTTDSGRNIEGVTDSNGDARISAEGITRGKKCRMSFNVSAAYQKRHDEETSTRKS